MTEKEQTENREEIYDTVIIGSGPAGLAAAIYAARAELNAITIEKNMISGGQVVNTAQIDNYPGSRGISGFDLAQKFRAEAEDAGARFVVDDIKAVDLDGRVKILRGENGTYQAKTVICANGAHHAMLGIPGEAEFAGAGVSYCATCDGAFFRKKDVAVIGGGDTALADAIYLARLCRKVYVIHRRDEFRGAKSLQKTLLSMENVEVIWNTIAVKINGNGKAESLDLHNRKTGEDLRIPVDGVFIAVGIEPESGIYKDRIAMDERGFIIAGEDGKTSVPGVYAAGDIRKKQLRQVITAAADGANCVVSASRYLEENKGADA